jgi:hypothetical protein
VTAAERAYRLLLRAYPADFRVAFGREMELGFRDRRREAGRSNLSFWLAMLWDITRSAPSLRLEEARARWSADIQIEEGKVKPMAILAILVGAAEAVNAMAEGWFGGIVNHAGYSLAGGAMGTVAGVLLVAAAIALLRRSPGAVAFAQAAAIACLAVFVSVRLLRPMFSILSTMLGIGFPIVLLLFLRWSRGRGPSEPMIA